MFPLFLQLFFPIFGAYGWLCMHVLRVHGFGCHLFEIILASAPFFPPLFWSALLGFNYVVLDHSYCETSGYRNDN
jgi:hypothetical protein